MKQQELRVSGSKRELIITERVPSTTADGGNAKSTPQEDVNTSSSDARSSESGSSDCESESSLSDSESLYDSKSEFGYVENGYEVLFVPDVKYHANQRLKRYEALQVSLVTKKFV